MKVMVRINKKGRTNIIELHLYRLASQNYVLLHNIKKSIEAEMDGSTYRKVAVLFEFEVTGEWPNVEDFFEELRDSGFDVFVDASKELSTMVQVVT